jgi:hypothetical protein
LCQALGGKEKGAEVRPHLLCKFQQDVRYTVVSSV